jgi:hypothetical protein
MPKTKIMIGMKYWKLWNTVQAIKTEVLSFGIVTFTSFKGIG